MKKMRNFAWVVDLIVDDLSTLLVTLARQDPVRMSFGRVLRRFNLSFIEGLKKQRVPRGPAAAAHEVTVEGLRTRANRIQEDLAETTTDIWSVYEIVRGAPVPLPAETIAETLYRHGDKRHEQVRSILHFLARDGVFEVIREGGVTKYRLNSASIDQPVTAYDLLVLIHREGPLTEDDLAVLLGVDRSHCAPMLERLVEDGLLQVSAHGELRSFVAGELAVGFGRPDAFAAGIYDHLSAICRAVTNKVRAGEHRAGAQDFNGGSTFTFVIPEGHPLRGEIVGFLATTNERLRTWRAATRSFEPSLAEDVPYETVTIYFGQMVEPSDGDET